MKTKRKMIPTNFWERLWYEYLFTRRFESETTLKATEVGNSFLELRENLQWNPFKVGLSFFFPRQRTVDIQYEGEGVYRFDIRTKRRQRSIDYTMAKATGFIEEQPDGQTRVEGHVQFGAVYHTLMLLLPIFMLLLFSVYTTYIPLFETDFGWFLTLPLVIVFGSVLWAWWRMLQDRNQLMQDLQTLLGDKRKREATERLSAEQAAEDLLAPSAEQLKEWRDKAE
jgi:hypothetical protein